MAPRIVLITGCSSGMGLTTAALLAEQPGQEFKVYATMRNLKSADDLKVAAGATLNKTLFIRELDVTKEATIKSVVDEIIRDNGRIDVLLNNAAYMGVDGIDRQSLEWGFDMMNTNFWGVVRMMRAVLPAMKKQKSGRILNVTSIVGLVGAPFYATYAATKFAVEGFTESCATILRDGYNIRISILEPGPVATALLAKTMGFNDKPENTKNYDPILKKLYSEHTTKANKMVSGFRQTAEEVAQLYLTVIRSDTHHLRYQTSKAMEQAAGAKLKDITTDYLLSG